MVRFCSFSFVKRGRLKEVFRRITSVNHKHDGDVLTSTENTDLRNLDISPLQLVRGRLDQYTISVHDIYNHAEWPVFNVCC